VVLCSLKIITATTGHHIPEGSNLHRLRVFMNGVPWKIFGSQEGRGDSGLEELA
jgi:hypothetical protein